MIGVGAIILRGDEVLLIQRGREPAYGEWSVPGGLVEVGESLADAVRREVLEEVGLDVAVGDLVVVLDRVIHDPEGRVHYHYVLLDFLCAWIEGEPCPASDVMDCAFVSLDGLGKYVMTRGTEEAIRRAFAQREGVLLPAYDPCL
jgi:ADP-ribose pyrophosphatase YjhB (NUDIX family)